MAAPGPLAAPSPKMQFLHNDRHHEIAGFLGALIGLQLFNIAPPLTQLGGNTGPSLFLGVSLVV